MWWHNGTRESDRLNSYWDAEVDGATHEALTDAHPNLDPNLQEAIARARAQHTRRRPDPAFALQLETTLMNAFVTTIVAKPPSRTSRYGTTVTTREWLHDRVAPRRWSLAALSSVALIALVLVAFFFTLRDSHHPAIVPVTPEASPTSQIAPTPTPTVEPVSMYRGGLDRTGEMPGPAPTGRPGVLWQAQTGAPIKGPVQIGNGLVYTGSDDGSVHAFDMITGAQVWKLTGSTAIESPSIVLDGTTAYIAGYDGMLLAVDAATGTEIWRTDPALNVSRRVAIDAGTQTLYVGGLGPVSYAFDSATGAIKWQVDLGSPQTSVASILTSDTIIFGAADALLYALDTADGSTRWTFDAGFASFGSLAYGNGTVYGAAGPAFIAIDAGTGAEKWRLESETASFSPAAVMDGNVILGTDLGELMAVSGVDGQVLWTFLTGKTSAVAGFGGPPTAVGDELIAVDTDGTIYALDANTGQELWRVQVDGGINYSPAITGGVIYTGTWEGSVYALGDGGAEIPVATPVASPASPVSSPESATSAPAIEVQINLLWETSGGPNQLGYTLNLAIAPDGNIWVADGPHSQFQIFSPNGEYVETWGTPGDGVSEFDFFRANSDGESFGAIAFAPDGTFYVADTGHQRILHFSPTREFLGGWGEPGTGSGKFISPFELHVDSQGNVYVNDDRANVIQKFTSDGTWLYSIGGAGSAPGQLTAQWVLTIDSEDNVWVADPDNNRVQGFRSNGSLLRVIDTTGKVLFPTAVAFDAEGRMYIVDWDGHQVVMLDANDEVIGSWEWPAELNLESAFTMVFDGEGYVYVPDSFSGRLLKVQILPAFGQPTE